MSHESATASAEDTKPEGIKMVCGFCGDALIEGGRVQKMPHIVQERFKLEGGGVLLNPNGQQMRTHPIICPDKPECYQGILAQEGWDKPLATSIFPPGAFGGPPPPGRAQG